MQADQGKELSLRGYAPEDSPSMNHELQRAHGYYTQPYDVNDGYLSTTSTYAPETYMNRNGEMMSQSRPNSFDSGSDSSGMQHFNYTSTSQPRIPIPTVQFTAPLNRTIFDESGQHGPPGGNPRVSTTIWEDEGTLCFQVEANSVTVARREDNNMINGTKLLNVAQMSRGKRDGILKNEATRSVIKVGSMHLKGVWIPFERALELANKNHVTDKLYPLFVNDIKKFLYHPTNLARTTAVLAAANTRQAQQTTHNGAVTEALHDDRPPLDRALSMPTPLDRSLSMLTPPSSASTNGDYWANPSSQHGPISDTQARTQSLPGTPATTPPAPAYFAHSATQSSAYPGSFVDTRLTASGNRYGQQADMQRSYHHSRNPSMMSYQEENTSNDSTHSLSVDSISNIQARNVKPILSSNVSEQGRYAQGPYVQRINPNPEHTFAKTNGASNQRIIPATPGHNRGQSKGHTRASSKVFNTPNLTTQMSRRMNATPLASPVYGHNRQSSPGTLANQASLWVQQQQQMTYNTPQQSTRGHTRQISGHLAQIFEETPSCRMAYQLRGQARMDPSFPQYNDQNQSHLQHDGSPMRSQQTTENSGSPLTGKKRRERVETESHQLFDSGIPYDDRQESLTPPPIARRDAYEDSPKRRRSERTGTHSRNGSVF